MLFRSHRRAGDAEIYFVSNQKNRPEELDASFRAGGRAPEWWDAATGQMRRLLDFRVEDGRVRVPLRLDAFGSGFVVLRGHRQPSPGRNWPEFKLVRTSAGPWSVTFPPNLGAPASATFDRLLSYTERAESGIRFFSGTATYEKDIEIPAESLGTGRNLYLDLGEVAVMAKVELNRQDLGILWRPPFRVRKDGAARPGVNHLVVRITNLWRNRIAGRH